MLEREGFELVKIEHYGHGKDGKYPKMVMVSDADDSIHCVVSILNDVEESTLKRLEHAGVIGTSFYYEVWYNPKTRRHRYCAR